MRIILIARAERHVYAQSVLSWESWSFSSGKIGSRRLARSGDVHDVVLEVLFIAARLWLDRGYLVQ